MPTYISLIRFTQKGIETIKEGPKRLDAAKEHVRLVAESDLLIVHAATAVSTRRRGSPNSYNLLRYDQGRLELAVRVVGAGGMSEQLLAAYNRHEGRWRVDPAPPHRPLL